MMPGTLVPIFPAPRANSLARVGFRELPRHPAEEPEKSRVPSPGGHAARVGSVGRTRNQ